jgi:hypothetical protein
MGESELVSHITFEQFCRFNGILAEPIQRTAAPTPDYRVSVGPKCYFVELKQLEPNEDDQPQLRQLETTGRTAGEVATGKRARNKVDKATRQLTRSAQRGFPTLLVLFNNTGLHTLGVHTDHAAIESAMYGRVAAGEPTISAVGVLRPYHPDCKGPYLVLYHNESADVPLDPEGVAHITDYQYRRQDRRPDEIGCWVHAITGADI